MKKGITFFILMILTGAFIGTIAGYFIGELIGKGPLYQTFSNGIVLGFNPLQLDLFFISMTVGMHIRINLFTILGIIVVLYFMRR